MVYIEQTIHIPKVQKGVPVSFRLVHQTTHEQYDLSVLDMAENAYYYTFQITNNQIKNGQYDYYVLDEDDLVLAFGIAQKGEYIADQPTEYNHEKTIIQYGQ